MKRVFTHIGFSFATALVVINLISVNYVLIITAGLAALFAVSLSVKKYRQALAVPLCFGSALFACLLFLCVYNSAVLPALSLSGNTADFSFYITDLPEFRGGRYVYIAKTTKILFSGAPQNIKIRIVSDTPIMANAYQIVNANAKLNSIGGGAFNSYGYWGDGIYLSAYVSEFNVTNTEVFSPMKLVLPLRNDIIEALVKALKGDLGALSAAFITGDKFYLSNETYNMLKLAGVSHLTAVSGLHLSVITVSAHLILKHIGAGVKTRSVTVAFLALFYVALAGFSSSAVRAGIMVITVFCAEFFNRKADSLNSLGLATLLICLNPFAVGDCGAVLSVLSVLSLLTVYPYLKELFSKVFRLLSKRRNHVLYPFKAALSYVLKSVLLSLSVILVTLPAMFLFFSYFTVASLISNVLLVPLGSAATVLSFLCYISLKTKLLCPFVLLLTSGVNSLILSLVNAFSSLKLLRVTLPYYYAFVIAPILLILALNFILFSNKKRKEVFAFALIILFLTLAINAYSQYNSAEVIVTESGALSVYYNGCIAVCNLKTKSDYYTVKSFIQRRKGNIDLLVDNNSDNYSEILSKEFSATRYVGKSDYTADFGNGFTVSTKSVNGKCEVIFCVNSTSISTFGGEYDIIIDAACVYDKNGVISLDYGPVIYNIYKNHVQVGRL